MVMREQISRLMDGDLDGAEAEAALRDLKRDEGLEHWMCYHVIGDALRRNATGPTPGFSARFASRLDAEPTVLAPQPARSSQPSRLPLAWAVAATVAAVAVVSTVAMSMLDPQPIALAKAREANGVRTVPSKPVPVSPDYLLAHQEYSPTTLIQGVGPYLRAVSAGDGR
jgi:sigma-E factor negative regulatory protein RseA